jgi:hypothetical protein
MTNTVAEYDALIERACDIAASAPFCMYCDKDEFARLSFEGDVAKLSWPEAQSGYYNSCSIETQSVKFPTELLYLPPDKFAAWKNAKAAQRAAKAAEDQRKMQALNEMRERAALADLKRKYPNG